MDKPVKIFFSYSHKDEKFCTDIKDCLEPLVRAGLVNTWYDRMLVSGSSWDDEIIDNLKDSNIIIFLLSKDFLASPYINDTEVAISLEMHGRGHAIVVPVMVRPCSLAYTPFKDIQGLPTDLVAITKWRLRDDAYTDIVKGLIKVINRVKDRQGISEMETSKWEGLVDHYKTNIDLVKLELETKQKRLHYIARELHDDIGSRLSVMNFYLQQLARYDDDTEKESTIEKMSLMLRETFNAVRQLSHSVGEDISTNDFDLKKEILYLESFFIKDRSLDLAIKFRDIEKIADPQLEINIFRIIQELLHNISKHSRATTASINLEFSNSSVLLEVRDNGIGYSTEHMRNNTGFGLKNIQHRVDSYNGSFTITSQEQGVITLISFPLDK